jgi:mycothiol S-conjugate amidase
VFQPLKLYYSTWTRRRIEAVHRALTAKLGESPFDESWFDRLDQDDRITTRIDVTGFMWARSGALRAHATQIDPHAPFWFGLEDSELESVYPYEDWILARSEVGPIPGHDEEFDLLTGISAVVEASG